VNKKRRNRRRLVILLFLIAAVCLFLLLRYRMVPIIRELAKTRVSNEASTAINRAVMRQIEEGNVAYDRIVFLEKNVQGGISAIKTNMGEVNRLRSEILDAVDEEILEISVSEIGIPMGSVVLPELFSGKGPALPVRVMSVSTSDAAFSSRFSSAGINQTQHQLLVTVSATMTVLTPLGTQNVSSDAQIIVAETVIVGTVPQTYMNWNK